MADSPFTQNQGRAVWLESWLLPVLVTLVGLALVSYGLDSKSLWFDELGTLTGAGWGGSWLDAIRYPLTIPTTPKPPLSFLVTRLFLALGDSAFVLRLPSAFFGVLTIPLTFALAETVFNRRIGLLAALLVAIAPLQIRYAQEARMYALFTFLSVLSLYLFWRALKSTDWRWWLTFALASVLALYTHLFALLPLGVLALFTLGLLLWRPRHAQTEFRFKGWHFAGALVMIVVAFTPMVPFLIEGLVSGEGLAGEAATDWGLAGLTSALRLFSGGSVGGAVIYAVLFLLATVVLAAEHRSFWVLAIMWVALPVIVVLVAPFGHKVRLRYFVFALPVYLLLVACGLTVAAEWSSRQLVRLRRSERWRSAARAFLITLLLGLLAAAAIGSLPAYYAETKQNWRDAVWLVRDRVQPGDLILVRHIYHQRGVLFYARQGPHGTSDWTEENVQIFPRDLGEVFPPDGQGSRWLIVPARDTFLPGGALEEYIQPYYQLLPPTVFEATRVPRDAQLISPTSFRSVAVVQAVRIPPPLIRFWADDAAIGQGDCTLLHWATSNIRELYLDGEGVVGQGTREVCPSTSTEYALRVIHRDGTMELQTLEIHVRVP